MFDNKLYLQLKKNISRLSFKILIVFLHELEFGSQFTHTADLSVAGKYSN